MQAGDEEEEEEWLNKVTGLLTYVCTRMYSHVLGMPVGMSS